VVTPRAALAIVACLLAVPATALGQTITVSPAADAVRVRANGWAFLTAEPLARLREGQTVRVELAVSVLAAPGRAAVTTLRRIFSVSYDLWEERFAVTIAEPRGRSASHLTAAAAEAWCLDQLAVPRASLGNLDEASFWIRLECRILDGDGSLDPDEGTGLTLQRLIDVLSRRRKSAPPARILDGGPFQLPR
jgi:hypothetical protein